MDHSPDVLKQIVLQLQSSGIQFSIKFIGSIAFEKSINLIPSQYQRDVALSCIKLVSNKANSRNVSPVNMDQFQSHFENVKYIIYNDDIDINVSSSAILLVNSTGTSMGILHRFKICDISIVSAGEQELASFFCFFAKIKDHGTIERRCFVFDGGPCVDEIRQVICYAFRISEAVVERKFSDDKSYRSTPEIRVDDVNCNTPPPLPLSEPPQLPQRSRRSCIEQTDCSRGSSITRSPSKEPRETGFGSNSENNGHNKELRIVQNEHQRHRSPSSNRDGGDSIELPKDRFNEMTADLFHQKWFHGKMSRSRAEALLRKKGQFLVRQSPHMENQFVLSGMTENDVKHICLLNKDGSIDLVCGKFKTIVGLICYCRENSDILPKRGLTLKLDYPVERQSYPVD